jgi:uncharacterized membrane protein
VSILEANAISFGTSLGLVLGYHLYLRYKLRNNPAYTIQAINAQAREIWVESIMTSRDRNILAVQTLRNSTMAATFLASTAILLIIGVLNLMQKNDGIGTVLDLVQKEHLTMSAHLWGFKLLPLLVIFFWAFFCFTLAIRMYNHVGYLINASSGKAFGPTPSFVAQLLNRSGNYYSLGMRAYYLSVPLVFWLFGPLYLLVASIGLVIVLYHVDRAPDVAGTPQEGSRSVYNASDPIPLVPRKGTGTEGFGGQVA